jgi:peroxiredoxin
MNKFIKFCFVFLSSFFMLFMNGCVHGPGKKEASIECEFLYTRGEIIYLDEILVYDRVRIDSAGVDNKGKCEFVFSVDGDAGIFWIGNSEDNYITLVIEKGEEVKIEGDIRNLPATYKVSGSSGSEKLFDLHRHTLMNYARLDSLSAIWQSRMYNDDKLFLRDSLDSVALLVYDDQISFVEQFAKGNKQSLASIIALYQTFGRVPVLDEFEYIDLFGDVAQSLKEKYPGNQHVNELFARVEKNKVLLREKEEIMKRLEPGNPVPALSLPDMNGAPESVSDYRGYVILIYFWHSKNPLCRKLNLQLADLYKLHAARGFLLFNVSFDNDTDIWKKTVGLDKLPGIHVNDQREWSSPVLKMFNIPDLPHSVLVDREGVIVANNLSIEEINIKLYELLPFRRETTPQE